MTGTGDHLKEWRSGETILSQSRLIEAQAARIAELEAALAGCAVEIAWDERDSLYRRIAELEALIADLSSELASEVDHRYGDAKRHPALKGDYEQDMDTVYRARAALEGKG